MNIRIGDAAVSFSLPRKPGKIVDLSLHIGREPVLLLFFPLAFSPVCTDEMCHLRDSWDRWKPLNVRIFGISADSPFITDKFHTELGIPFPILSDFNREVATVYGVLHEDLFGLKDVPKRAAFAIGTDGKVTYTWVTDDPSIQIPFDDVIAALAR